MGRCSIGKGWTAVRVVGPSMEPALRNGDWWLVHRTPRYRVGAVLLLRHPTRPGLLVIKRVTRTLDDGYWVEGDNPSMSDDSRNFGPVATDAVVGRLVLRYRRGRRGRAR